MACTTARKCQVPNLKFQSTKHEAEPKSDIRNPKSRRRANLLVIPSAEGSMTTDIEDERLIDWIREAAITADWVITVCDGAFPLAATGLLDGRTATTFPSDREALAEMFPSVYVRDDARLVVDGKFITSVGGGMSCEPAFYLVERLFGPEHARLTAEGLVWPWDLSEVPSYFAESD